MKIQNVDNSAQCEIMKIDILPLLVITTVQRDNTHGKDVGHTTKPCDRCQLPQAAFEPARIIALGVIAIYSPGALPTELSPRLIGDGWLIRCGDKTRTQKQVCEIFNTKYPDRRIFQSTVSRIENKFREFGNVTDIPKSGRKRILDDEQKLDILLDIQDNPHKPTRQVAADNDVSKTSIMRLLKDEKYQLRMLFPDDDNPNEIDRNI
ncbi:hypothetical protein NQ318_018453 [Aromia moschata]|uniref:DUF4817 domain-containing protein n=1 Tax=Aromia moschata TaxID=1265417 RepID=A0AAV8YN03_9CUCU|nr:hypothetical protein NQ318_018453 [Aromia moschata]